MNITELFLQTNQILETKKFYSEILELDLISESEKSITFQAGTSKLTFEITTNNIDPRYHFAFNIPSNQLLEAKDWLSKKTNLIQTEDFKDIITFENWKAKAIYFYDNNNNILELICREDLPTKAYKTFTSQSILNISEVGIGTDNPLEIAQLMYEQYNVDYFAKGPKREDFVALGNEEGLFVISKTNRNWFPTNHLVEMQNLKIVFSEKNKIYTKTFNT